MEWKEATQQGAVSLAVGIIQRARVPADRPSMMKANADKFHEAWEEGHLAQYGGEPKRAQCYYRQALEAAPEDIDAEALAEVLEGLKSQSFDQCLAVGTRPRTAGEGVLFLRIL